MLLEFALSAFGLVMFIYVVLKVWMWTNTTLVQRQASFQATRLQAGQEASAGMYVPYQRPPLRLIGPSDSVGSPPPSGTGVPPCTAAQPFFNQAEALMRQSEALRQEGNQRMEAAHQTGLELQQRANACAARPRNRRGRCFEALQPLIAQLQQTTQDAQALRQQAQALLQQARDHIRQGNAACR